MAKNDNPGKVDQGKVSSEAENLAKGGSTSTPERGDLPEASTASDLTQSPVVREPLQQQTNPNQQPEKLDEDEAEKKLHDQLKEQYGPGFVRAQKDNQTTTFTARAWELLGENKEGWKPLTKKPKEVKDLEAKKAGSEK